MSVLERGGGAAVMLAAPKSGSGKTLITISLLKALCNRGKNAAAFKCGPDYIDPLFHEKILGVPSKNLDLFFTDEIVTRNLFENGVRKLKADFSVIEGVMGLYDGLGGYLEEASSYHLAKVLNVPVVLIVDTKGMGRSVLAEIVGFLALDRYHLIKGIILNNISVGLYENIKTQIEKELNVQVLGYFPNQKDLHLESRYLGLKLPSEIEDIQKMVGTAAVQLENTVDVDEIIRMGLSGSEEIVGTDPDYIYSGDKVRIGIAKDDAFCFYYSDNLKLLENYGAELIEFSPLKDHQLPDNLDGLILSGGYPELFAKELAENVTMKYSIRKFIQEGGPSLAECGGFMYLHNSITTQNGNSFEMCGVIDGDSSYTGKLVRFGYVTLSEKGGDFFSGNIKGHEFHYFDSTANGTDCMAVKPVSGRSWECSWVGKNHWWGFTHLYYPSNPEFAETFVNKCRTWKKEREKSK